MHSAEMEQDVDPDLIAAYLRRHPDFFMDYENLLSDLALPHHAGGQAVSLVERQVSVLRARNREVRHRLNRLLETARENDHLFQKTQRLVLALIEQPNIDSVVNTVLTSLRDDFNVDTCALFLIAQPLLAVTEAPTVSLELARQNIGALLNSSATVCGHLRAEENGFLFPNASQEVQSAAVAQILHNNALLGVLAIGSFDVNRYRSNTGVLFLSYITAVLNRIIVRFMRS